MVWLVFWIRQYRGVPFSIWLLIDALDMPFSKFHSSMRFELLSFVGFYDALVVRIERWAKVSHDVRVKTKVSNFWRRDPKNDLIFKQPTNLRHGTQTSTQYALLRKILYFPCIPTTDSDEVLKWGVLANPELFLTPLEWQSSLCQGSTKVVSM